MSWQLDYFQRVRPIIGEVFAEQTLAIWGAGSLGQVAEALARTGLTRQLHFGDAAQPAPPSFCRSFGERYRTQPAMAAIEGEIRGHNRFEQGWQLQRLPAEPAQLKQTLTGSRRPSVLLAAVDSNARTVADSAMEAGIPFVLLHRSIATNPSHLALVWHPESSAERGSLLACCDQLASRPQISGADPADHLNGLEAQSLALNLVRWLLAPQRPSRPDLEAPLVQGGTPFVLRGSARWPWEVRFASANQLLPWLAANPATPSYRPPLSLLKRQRLLVLGLGTSSLFVREAANYFDTLVLLDCKEVSPFNPVRQAYGSDHIGVPKAAALAGIVATQLAPGDDHWELQQQAGLTLRTDDSRRIWSGELELTQRRRSTLQRWRAILDATEPTIAVIAMGRSRDDNFLAAMELRRRGIRHVTPSAFPAVSHFKHVLTDGAEGPCYDCLQGHLAIDSGPGPELPNEQRELFYGGTQPATLAETLPSAHSLLRLVLDLALPRAARPAYLSRELAAERNCLVGANRVEQLSGGEWLYGVDRPFRMVSYGIEDLVGSRSEQRCPCGRVNKVRNVIGS